MNIFRCSISRFSIFLFRLSIFLFRLSIFFLRFSIFFLRFSIFFLNFNFFRFSFSASTIFLFLEVLILLKTSLVSFGNLLFATSHPKVLIVVNAGNAYPSNCQAISLPHESFFRDCVFTTSCSTLFSLCLRVILILFFC